VSNHDLIIQPGVAPDDPLAVFIMGPTATGKTDLAIELAERNPMDIISVDSAMVYRGMDIGSAKPDAQTLRVAPHRLIDICDPAEAYSAGRFRDDALREMADIASRGRIPLLVGGTMLYFRTLQQGIADLPDADPEIRARLDAEAARLGWDAMHRRLAGIDPAAAERIHSNDPQRIQRALEVYEISGMTLTEFWRTQARTRLAYRLLKIALMPPDRVELRRRIGRRFDAMLDQGLIEEVRRLYSRGDLTADLPSMRAVGYRQIWEWLESRVDFATMREKAIIATAQLAKRQMTWLRSEQDCNFIDPDDVKSMQALKNSGFLLR
jgi:tRNA dimethylallyltransferase